VRLEGSLLRVTARASALALLAFARRGRRAVAGLGSADEKTVSARGKKTTNEGRGRTPASRERSRRPWPEHSCPCRRGRRRTVDQQKERSASKGKGREEGKMNIPGTVPGCTCSHQRRSRSCAMEERPIRPRTRKNRSCSYGDDDDKRRKLDSAPFAALAPP